MNLAEAINKGKKEAPVNNTGAILVSSDGSVYVGGNENALKAHCKKFKLTLYNVLTEQVIYSPRSKK